MHKSFLSSFSLNNTESPYDMRREGSSSFLGSADESMAAVFPIAASLLNNSIHADEYDSYMQDIDVAPSVVKTPRYSDFATSTPIPKFYSEDTSYLESFGNHSKHSDVFQHSFTDSINTSTLSNVDTQLKNRPEEEWFHTQVDGFVSGRQNMGETPSSQASLELVQLFIEVCDKRLQELANASTHSNTVTQKLIEQQANVLSAERNTWQLIQQLYSYRGTDSMQEAPIEPVTQVQVAQKVETDNRGFREIKIICEWLEAIAGRAMSYDINKVVHLRTIQQLKSGSAPLFMVTELDPDAPSRQSRSLDTDDMNYEERFLKALWDFIRSGAFAQALELCNKCGQPWRVMSMGGNSLFDDVNSPGNQFRNAWKESCRAISQDRSTNKYEAAVYGILSQNLDAVLPVCLSWEDHLWAHLKVLSDTILDKELEVFPHPFGGDPSRNITSSLTVDLTVPDVLLALKSKRSSQENYHVVQEKVILGDIEGLLSLLSSWASNANESVAKNTISPELLRFAAHVVMFFDYRGAHQKTSVAREAILSAYIQHLIKVKKPQLVARYTALLPPEPQELMYANFLKDISDSNAIQTCLMLAERAGLNVKRITSRVVELKKHVAKSIAAAPRQLLSQENDTQDADNIKIGSIEYLCWEPSQRAEALIQANALIRELVKGKLESAYRILAILPSDSRAVVLERINEGDKEVKSNALREYIGFECLLQAHSTYNAWKSYHYKKPEAPSQPIGKSVPEQIEFESKLKSYKEKFNVWREKDEQNMHAATNEILKVLRYENGWMVDTLSGDTERKQQMLLLRRKCIPELTFMLYTVLYSSADHQTCIDTIATLLADERYMLYTTFKQEEIQKLMLLLQQSALAALKV